MHLDGLLICDFCNGVIFPDDGTPVTLTVGEKPHRFDYHNTLRQPCLKKKLEQLKKQFAAQQDSNL